MTSRDFCYWLQGFFEIGAAQSPSVAPFLGAEQVQLVQRHLALVFIHEIDPSAGPPTQQEVLNKIHEQLKKNEPPKIGGVGPDGMVYRC